MSKWDQGYFDVTIGTMDRALSLMIQWAIDLDGDVDQANRHTLKHHAEDMIGAGQKILKELEGQLDIAYN